MPRAGNPTERRRRQVRWAKRLRRVGRAWENALEIARAGRLTAPYGAPFALVHEDRIYRLRRYAPDAAGAAAPPAAPLLLVPPLMVTAEVYDISPDVSAVAYLTRAAVDVWLVDFGAPEREEGGMNRTLDDHVRAVSDAVERVRAATGRDVHLAGYSQGGMFCYQAAAFRRAAGVASIIALGSPVDLHRTLQVGEGTTERLIGGLRAALSWPLARIEGLPGFFTSTGFKLLSARKEVVQLVDFVKNLHDREALEKREAKRLFLGGEGFVAWPGPAFRKFVDELIVGNRMASGGFVIDGHSVTLADITCPILYFLGSRDEMGRPAAVRGIQRACPRVSIMYELPLSAGHFGLVVGTTALTITWPSIVTWMRWREGIGGPPERAIDVRAGARDTRRPANAGAPLDGHDDHGHDDPDDDHELDDPDDPDPDDERGGLDLARGLVDKTARIIADRLHELSEDLGDYLDNARYQLPRLARLRNLQDDSLISLGKTLADQARDIADRTFFLFRGRAFSYADANRRVDAVVRGLVATGIRSGDHVGVMMKSRPSQLSAVTALNRIGAVAVLLSPATPDDLLPRALELGEADVLIVDPDGAARSRAAIAGRVLVLGGVGEVPWQPGVARVLPPGVVDLEAIDPDAVALPAWYRPDPGRARDLAMVFVAARRDAPLRATRITNRRWAFSALGAAAAATLTTRDTVYCCLPLHHPSGTLVATGSALISGARLALASAFTPDTFSPRPSPSATPSATLPVPASPAGARDSFGDSPEGLWDEVRRYGASVVYYAGEMCRRLVDAPSVVGEANHPVRLFAGSGLRSGVWRRLVDRFGPVGVLEMYASSEAHIVLANARGKKLGSVGRPLPGSPDVAIAAWSLADDDFARDGAGHLVHARLDEPGMLIAALAPASSAAALAYIDPRRILHDAFAPGDRWFVTGDLFRADTEGDYWFVDRQHHMIATRHGAVASTRIEDALYDVPGIALCAVIGRPEPATTDATAASPAAPSLVPAASSLPPAAPSFAPAAPSHAPARLHQIALAAIQLQPGASVDLDALSRAVVTLPEYARPHRVRRVDTIAMTDGFRPIKDAIADLDFSDGPDSYTWDARAQRYQPTAHPAARSA